MKSLTLLFFFVSTFNSFAHDASSWTNDYEAFEYTYERLVEPTDDTRHDSIELAPLSLEIDKELLRQKLEEFSGFEETVLDGEIVRIEERGSYKGRLLAHKYLKQEYKKIGFKVSEHEYSNRGKNFIAEKKGTDGSKTLILSSHIDSVGNAGANDDGTGTIGALAIATALSKMKNKHTLRILGFDQEEIGLVGSHAYAGTLKKEDIIGTIQIEMMGTNSRKDGGFHVIDCDRKESVFLSDHVMAAVDELKLPLNRVKACTRRSDHSSFWNNSIPAIVLSENFFGGDGDRCYHRACDIFDARLDFDYMKNILDAVATAVGTLLRE